MGTEHIIVCDSCRNEVDTDEGGTVTVHVAEMDGSPLYYCSPQCMLDNWHARMSWYVTDKTTIRRSGPS